MKITPLEIRQKAFEKGFRGYDKDEVNAFLLSLSGEWERMIDENKDLRTKLEASDKEVNKLREVENTLFKTLQTAESTGNTIMEQANRQAELELKDAGMKAEKMVEQARSQAQQTVEQAERRSEAIVREMQEELKELAQRFRELENYRDDIINSLRGLSGEIIDKTDRFKKHQPEVSLKTIFARAKQAEEKEVDAEPHADEVPEGEPVEEMASEALETVEPLALEVTPEPEPEETPPSPNELEEERVVVAEEPAPIAEDSLTAGEDYGVPEVSEDALVKADRGENIVPAEVPNPMPAASIEMAIDEAAEPDTAEEEKEAEAEPSAEVPKEEETVALPAPEPKEEPVEKKSKKKGSFFDDLDD